jgi:thiosulfate dehydrogenase
VHNFTSRRKLPPVSNNLGKGNAHCLNRGENGMLKGVILGVLLGALLIVGGTYFYFAGGHAPVATKSPEMPFEHRLAHMAQDAYLDKLPHLKSPVAEDEPNFLAGARVYRENCAVCHGLPGEPKTAIAEGMFPPPPQLFRGTGVTDDEAWETFWKMSGGIRMTGMPGFSEHLGETKMWQVSVLLKNADKISPAVKAELAGTSTTTLPTTTLPVGTTPGPAVPGQPAALPHN